MRTQGGARHDGRGSLRSAKQSDRFTLIPSAWHSRSSARQVIAERPTSDWPNTLSLSHTHKMAGNRVSACLSSSWHVPNVPGNEREALQCGVTRLTVCASVTFGLTASVGPITRRHPARMLASTSLPSVRTLASAGLARSALPGTVRLEHDAPLMAGRCVLAAVVRTREVTRERQSR